MKTNTLFQVRFRPSVKPPRGFTKSAHYNVLSYDWHNHKYLIGNTWLHASNFIKIKVEDAPVFKKPPLRKIASLKPDEVIECNTDAELKAVLEQAEREGLVWFNKKKPTEHIPTDPTPLYVYTTNDKRLAYFAKKLSSFTPLPASKFVEVEAEGIQDLPISKYPIKNQSNPMFEQPKGEIAPPAPELKPFPQGYMIPKGTRVVAIKSNSYVKNGSTGITKEKSCNPFIRWDGTDYYREEGEGDWAQDGHYLAPLDPRDHPEHPEFGKGKQEEPITQAQKDECLKLQERIKELEALCELRQQDIDNFADDLSDCNELINRMKELAKSSLSASNDMLNRAALRAIANGEI